MQSNGGLLFVRVQVHHQGSAFNLMGLVDTGCQLTIVKGQTVNDSHQHVLQGDREPIKVYEINGESCMKVGRVPMGLQVGNGRKIMHKCAVTKETPWGCSVVLGIDFLRRFQRIRAGEMEIFPWAGVKPDMAYCHGTNVRKTDGCKALLIKDKDFDGVFNGKQWTIRWKWKDQPAKLVNRTALYSNARQPEVAKKFNAEVQNWIAQGWLHPISEKNCCQKGGIIPLMAVVQPNKDKVRPVLDFRELNKYVQCHSGDEIAVCDDSMRRWRRLGAQVKIVDLKSAYLQLRVAKDLWPFQQVEFQGRRFWLTRLGFGLNCAPRIMTRVLREVLEQDNRIQEATEPYVDDILVDESKVNANHLVKHLADYGLEAKEPVGLDGGKALGLKIYKHKDGKYWFSRGNSLNDWRCGAELTRERLFSLCGKVVGHYPVAGWARVACSFIKRMAEGEGWKDKVGPLVTKMAAELLTRVEKEDPIRGVWEVPRISQVVVWSDASALGAVLEIADYIVEDAAWLRPKDDVMHINLAELEAAVKGLNLALKWDLKDVKMMVDSSTVYEWIRLTLSGEKRVKTKGAAELLVKRRLAVLGETVKEYGVKLEVFLVTSLANKADRMTRVPKTSVTAMQRKAVAVAVVNETQGVERAQRIQILHDKHHMGVERTLYLAHKTDATITKEEVRKCVEKCQICKSIDPAPVREPPGKLSVDKNWSRVAIDVTHYSGGLYLSLIDCGPSRFTIWRQIPNETATRVVEELREIFFERGMPREVLMDNSRTFHSRELEQFCLKWGVMRHFRGAGREQGNGIVERVHRTIKRIAARSRISIQEACFWFNASSGPGGQPSAMEKVFTYEWRYPMRERECQQEPTCRYQIGDIVWVKSRNNRCDTQWNQGVVTGIKSNYTIEVNGMAHSIRDVRLCVKGIDRENINQGSRLDEEIENNVPSMSGGAPEGDESENGSVSSESDTRHSDSEGDDEEQISALEASPDSSPEVRTRSGRVIRPPQYLRDYDLTDE